MSKWNENDNWVIAILFVLIEIPYFSFYFKTYFMCISVRFSLSLFISCHHFHLVQYSCPVFYVNVSHFRKLSFHSFTSIFFRRISLLCLNLLLSSSSFFFFLFFLSCLMRFFYETERKKLRRNWFKSSWKREKISSRKI